VPELLERPLASRWLDRVSRSTAAAPLRSGGAPGRIAVDDWNALLQHPQFCG
jgi:hypothetical protein